MSQELRSSSKRADRMNLTSGQQSAFDYRSIYDSESFRSAFQYKNLSGNSNRSTERRITTSKLDEFLHRAVIASCWVLCIVLFPISAWLSIKRLKPHEKLVIFRLGRLKPAKGPGTVFILPLVDSFKRVDTRTRAFNVPPQKIFTVDNGVVEVGADVHFHVVDAVESVLHVKDLSQSMRSLAQLALMNQFNKRTVSELMADKQLISTCIKDIMNNTVGSWGIRIEKFETSHVTVIHKEQQTDALSNVLNALGGNLPTEHASVLKMMAGAVSQRTDSTIIDLSGASEQAPPVLKTSTPALADIAVRILRDVMDSTIVNELGAVYKFVLTGDSGGVFHLDAKHGNGLVDVGEPLQVADVTMTSSAEDFHRLISGDVNPLSLYMGGRLIVEGDLALAMKLDALTDKIDKFISQKSSATSPTFAEGFVHHL